MYSDEKKKIALNLLKETKSVTKTIRILGYPTNDIVNPSNTNITKLINPPIAGVITFSIITTILFIVLTIFSAITVYRIWADDKEIKDYKNLLEFSKRFIFRIPLLIVTLGFFLPNLMMGKITSLSYEIMIHGLYVVPIFMLIIKKINFRRG